MRAFQRALGVVETLGDAEIAERAAAGTLTEVDGLGPSTARVIVEALSGVDDGYLVGGGRPPSSFDADIVFAACAQFDKAVEINCRPERQDPPEELLRIAVEWGRKVTIDTDAHATGQLEWQAYGADKAVRCDVPIDDIVNTWPEETFLEWTAAHSANGCDLR